MSIIADNIKILMNRKGVSAYQMQKDTENVIKQSTLSRILNEEHEPRRITLKRIADYFGITTSQLIGDEPLPQYINAEYPAGPIPEGADPELWERVPAKLSDADILKVLEFADTFVRSASLEDPHDQRILKLLYYTWLKKRRALESGKKSKEPKTDKIY